MSQRTFSVTCPAGLRPFGGVNGHPGYQANQERAKHKGFPLDPSHCCVICGKAAVASAFAVRLADTGEYVTEAEMRETDLGFYPVGSDCAKKLRKAGIEVVSST